MTLDADTLVRGGGLLAFAWFILQQQIRITSAIETMAKAMTLTSERQDALSRRQEAIYQSGANGKAREPLPPMPMTTPKEKRL